MESLVILAIIILVVVQPAAVAQLNTTILGKIIILSGLITATLYKPYIGLLVLLLIVCLTMNREGLDHDREEEEQKDEEDENNLSVENEEKLQL